MYWRYSFDINRESSKTPAEPSEKAATLARKSSFMLLVVGSANNHDHGAAVTLRRVRFWLDLPNCLVLELYIIPGTTLHNFVGRFIRKLNLWGFMI
jgi:hypothetical protein